jgi:cell division protein FtsQ
MGSFLQQQEVKKGMKRRQRLVKWARSTQRISIVVLVWLLGVAILYSVYHVVFVQPYFEVKTIEVSGDMNRLPPDQIRFLAQIPEHSNLFSTRVSEIKHRILRDKWVKDLAVRRMLPDKLAIFVTEYKPVAIVSLDRLYFVDDEGTIFKEVEAGDPKDYPVLTGLDMSEGTINTPQKVRQLEMFLDLKRMFEKNQAADLLGLSEINYDQRIGYSIVTFQPSLVIKIGYDGFEEKLKKLQAILPVMQRQAGKIQYVDVNFERKVIVKYGA